MVISEHVYKACRSETTVTSELAKNPTETPHKIAHRLFGSDSTPHHTGKAPQRKEPTAEDLQRALDCGKWGKSQPSELFQRIYHDVLCTLDEDIMGNMVSPPLIGSTGVCPLTIISTIPDIVRHMSNCIVRAEREVYLATNFWQASDPARLITNAFKELSRCAGERGNKVVIKVIYDRGNAKQFLDNHQPVSEKEWTGDAVKIPPSSEIPNLDMQIVNYHRPLLGTFHSKFMIVDRRIAILQSNNIQANDNVEMMIHLEGAIVDSFYDMALITWSNALKPPLPCLDSPAALDNLGSFEQNTHKTLFNEDGSVRGYTTIKKPGRPAYGNESASGHASAENRETSMPLQQNGSAQPSDPTTTNGEAPAAGFQNQDQRERLPEHTPDDPHYDVDIAAEATRVQSVISPTGSESHMNAVTRQLNYTKNPGFKGDAPECAPGEEMMPYIPHPVHEPFPIAMVCRKPYGAPNNNCVYTPQNEAWISGIRNAKKSVFIQTPNMNAVPLIPELMAAAKRGVAVYCYVCLGYNDAGELLPYQGGTNEMIAHKMIDKNMHIYFYVAKDQTKPINNKFKKRSCHIKLMIVDEHIGIQGNGNQDTQSWFHSQEINVMLDSHEVCAAWIDGLRRNQNTHIYGKLGDDGVWRDSEGKEAEGSIGVDPGRFSWAKGIIGAVQRVRGAGGF